MTEKEANRLLLMLQYNFATFYPADVQGIAVKKGTWMAELVKYDAAKAEKAVRTLIQTLHYAPQIVDFREAIGMSGELTRDDIQARLPGPTFGTEEGYKAMYTADPEHVKAVMDKLMRELA